MTHSALTRAATAGALLFTLALAAGCGGAGPTEGADLAPSPTPAATVAAELPDDLCSVVTAVDLGSAIGATVTTSTGPTGDCEFKQEDLRAARGSVGVVRYADTNGGYDGYLTGLGATMTKARQHPVSGVGTRAVVVTGIPTMGSGANLMAAGAADRGNYLVVATVAQGQGDSEAKLTRVTTALLRALDNGLN